MFSSIEKDYIFLFDVDGTLTGTTTLSQSGFGSNGNEVILHTFPKSSRTGASPLDGLVSYPEYSLRKERSYPFADILLTYSTAPTDWAVTNLN